MTMAETLEPFVAGGASALLAVTIIHPLDLAKVRLQLLAELPTTGASKKPWFPSVIADELRRSGIRGIYAGISAAWMRQAVYGSARIGLHRALSAQMLSYQQRQGENAEKTLSFAKKALASGVAACVAVALGTPFDVALVRMQSDALKPAAQRRGYRNVFDALFRVVREEGMINLYRGLWPNVCRGMAMNIGMLACFDQAKETISEFIPSSQVQQSVLASMVAGFTASAFSLPFDLLKSRLQDSKRYKGIADAAVKVLTQEGVLAFWTGFGAYYLRTAPHSMIILLTQQPFSHAYRQLLQLQRT